MMNTLPLRRTTLHLAQRFRIDGETFITKLLLTTPATQRVAKVWIIHVFRPFVQLMQNNTEDHWTVRMRGAPSVTAIVCSKCAVKDPSADTTVH